MTAAGTISEWCRNQSRVRTDLVTAAHSVCPGINEVPSWRALQVLECGHNCIAAMDPSLLLLPALQV